MSAAAALAAQIILDAGTSPGTRDEASLIAKRLAEVVLLAAAASAQDTARAVVDRAEAVAEAAAEVALKVSEVDMAIEQEVAGIAVDLSKVATASALRMAAVTERRVEGAALLAHQAAAAV